ncbi:unnamed protein product [Owenia fusiformis]|uniref:Sarcospan n=1 Tax=Owenia fusiformis TaxID=6347 RepID=A0A8S4NMX1_OWEFU|nr:unnamed protein product [Owenia fusiformis]
MSQFDIKRENFEMKCCKIKVLLVTMQLCVGIVITALSFYLQTLSSSMKIRETPYWAGLPLLVAGIVGIYFCATDIAAYAGSTKAFIVKSTCFLLSFCCLFVCMVSSVFCGIPANMIASFNECTNIGTNSTITQTCRCEQDTKTYDFNEVESCDVVMTSIKDYLILLCALNSIGSGVSMWFVGLLWKSRYRDFHSGLRFYSYSASVPDHP